MERKLPVRLSQIARLHFNEAYRPRRISDAVVLESLSLRFLKYLLVVLLGLLFTEYLIEVLLTIDKSSFNELQAAVPDEALFLEIAGNGGGHFGLAYGPFFWSTLRGLTLLIPADHTIMISRLIFISFKYIAWVVVLVEMWKLQQYRGATVFVLTMLLTPGYMFFGKAISPEYMIIMFPMLSAVFLYRDKGKFQTFYLIALFLAWLAFLSKISTVPLLFMIIVYGAVYPLQLNFSRKQYVKLLGQMLSVSLVVLLVVLMYCWESNVFDDIRLAFTLVSPWDFSSSSIEWSWNMNSATWDQIKIGGIYIDFLPAFVFSVIGLLLLIIPGADKEIRVISFVIYVSAILMLVTSVFRNSGHTWYFFTAFSLLSVATAYLVPERSVWRLSVIVVTLLLTLSVSIPRLKDRIGFKMDVNTQLSQSQLEMQSVDAWINKVYGCAKTVDLDILVPAIDSIVEYTPLRISLQKFNSKQWILPDMLIVNTANPSGTRSPLLQYVVKDRVSDYKVVKEFGFLSVYALTSLSCLEQNQNSQLVN